ncbi:peroxide stress protein YaaA [Nesterenkonia sp. YGD6]|uniref:YaaA family protein n=1 Tax=Nesterenkonia sp. YGD6 TaxID=2901231 RepID=UPI001F4C6E24|nr:peroxide stress protein YaaA [Nesterenkonia sp. YGD6]
MLIFLPPSEGKTPPTDPGAPPVDLRSLTLPELDLVRATVMDALIQVSGHEQAQQMLNVGKTMMPQVRANARLVSAPTAPAHEIYTGVLFEALDPASLSPEQLDRASRQVLVFSGLFGVTSLTDRIPAYRLSMGVSLSAQGTGQGPGAAPAQQAPGRLGSFWKAALDEPLSRLIGDQLVVDCRSSSYGQAHRPAPEQTLMVNSFTERDGQRKVVTHFAKHARGLLTGMLLRAQGPAPETVDDVAELASRRWRVELRPATGRTPHQLDLID